MDYQEILKFLNPYLPYLIAGGAEVAKGAAKKLGETFTQGTLERAKKLWAKLRPKVENQPAAQEAIRDLIKVPDDPDALAALNWQIGKALKANPDLALELIAELRPARAAGIAEANHVAPGGELTGIEAEEILSGAEAIGRATANTVEGKVTGIKIGTIGG